MIYEHVLGVEPGKEHYSTDIKLAIYQYAAKKRTLLLIVPPGTGKTFAASELSVEIVSGVSPILRYVGMARTVMIAEPYHPTLLTVAETVKKAYMEALKRGLFGLRLPILFILKGSIYSCINEEMRKIFEEMVRVVRAETKLDLEYAYTLMKQLEAAWPFMSVDEREDILRKLMMYTKYSYIELSLSYLCQLCPYRKRELLEKLLEIIGKSRIDIVDTEAPEALKLLSEIRKELEDKTGMDRACVYRAALLLTLEETYLGRLIGRPFIIVLTHAMVANPVVAEYLEQRYSILTATGRAARHIHIIDEVDCPLFSPPTVTAPAELSPTISGYRDEAEFVKYLQRRLYKYATPVKSTRPTGVKALIEVMRLVYKLYQRIEQEILSQPVTRAEAVRRMIRVLREFLQQIQNLDRRLIYEARRALRTIRLNITERMKREVEKRGVLGIDIEDIVTYSIAARAVDFVDHIQRLAVWELSDFVIAHRFEFPLLHTDPRNWFSIELDPRLGLARVSLGSLQYKLYELALRFSLSPEYPYPVLLKIGLTATFSKYWIRFLSRICRPADIADLVLSEVHLITMSPPYVNVHFYRIFTWVPGDVYEEAVTAGLARLRAVLERVARARQSVMLPEYPKKKILLMDVSKRELRDLARRFNVRLRFAAEHFLNVLHEILDVLDVEGILSLVEKIMDGEASPSDYDYQISDVIRIALFYGTKSQMFIAAENLMLLREIQRRTKQWIRHGNYEFFIDNVVFVQKPLHYVVHVRARRLDTGRVYKVEVAIMHARGQAARGVNLEQFNAAVVVSPPLSTPHTIISFVSRRPEENPLIYILSAVATEQSTFRTVRRTRYRVPKVIALDYILTRPPYIDKYSTWFAILLQRARDSRVLTKLHLAVLLST